MCSSDLETYEDLNSYREKAAAEIDSLKAERDSLRNELKRVMRRGDESEITAVKAKIAEVTEKIQKLRDGTAICDSVEKRAVQLQAEYDSLRNENKEKEETNDELFGRSGGTGREDESERRGSRS